ncbi:MAG: NUMOD3 domain-containing DNA-binding protein [Bryobacteraceae bacterium]
MKKKRSILNEKEYFFWRNRSDLCNKTDGGDGVSGLVMSDEARQKMSQKAKGRPGVKSMLGKKHSPETRAKMRAAKSGKTPNNSGKKYTKKPMSDEHKAKISESRKHYVTSAETRAKLSAKTKLQWMDPLKRPRRLKSTEA